MFYSTFEKVEKSEVDASTNDRKTTPFELLTLATATPDFQNGPREDLFTQTFISFQLRVHNRCPNVQIPTRRYNTEICASPTKPAYCALLVSHFRLIFGLNLGWLYT